MTAYIAFSALKQKSLALGQTIRVSERAWRVSGSRMFIEPRKPVTVQELLHGMIVQSGNGRLHRARRDHRGLGSGVRGAHEPGSRAHRQ